MPPRRSLPATPRISSLFPIDSACFRFVVVKHKKIDAFTKYFFLSRYIKLNRVLCMSPWQTHRKEALGWGAAININTITMPSGPANGSAMVVVFFWMLKIGDHPCIPIPTLKTNERLECVFCVTMDNSYSSKLILMLHRTSHQKVPAAIIPCRN
jgi:hypothetical protein